MRGAKLGTRTTLNSVMGGGGSCGGGGRGSGGDRIVWSGLSTTHGDGDGGGSGVTMTFSYF